MTEPAPSSTREQVLDQLARAAYRLSAADSRLRGRATRTVGALSSPTPAPCGSSPTRAR